MSIKENELISLDEKRNIVVDIIKELGIICMVTGAFYSILPEKSSFEL